MLYQSSSLMLVCIAVADSTELRGLHVIFPSTTVVEKNGLLLSRSQGLPLEMQRLLPENCFLRKVYWGQVIIVNMILCQVN